MLDKNFIKKIEEKLRADKTAIEEALKRFATKDEKLAGDWDTRFPDFNGGHLEESADEVEEYETLLPIEHSLENRLKDIDSALKKIENGTYGKCERCGKEISLERLEFYPEAKTCSDCQKIRR